jgi:hypothetical protein
MSIMATSKIEQCGTVMATAGSLVQPVLAIFSMGSP